MNVHPMQLQSSARIVTAEINNQFQDRFYGDMNLTDGARASIPIPPLSRGSIADRVGSFHVTPIELLVNDGEKSFSGQFAGRWSCEDQAFRHLGLLVVSASDGYSEQPFSCAQGERWDGDIHTLLTAAKLIVQSH
jgi:hypothetical protein